MTERAIGSFEVTLKQQLVSEAGEEAKLGRMSIEKKFQGDLEAIARGEMLASGSNVPGSAAYVAIETITGKLHGRSGTFALHHKGTMTRGVGKASITVVPDSGTEELEGINGEMTINVIDGNHLYEFEYSLASPEDK